MDFELSKKMTTILTMVDEFVREVIIPLEGEMLHGSPDTLARQVAEAQVKVREMGLWGPNLPKDVGGLGLGLVEHGLVSEALGARRSATTCSDCQAPDAGNIEILTSTAASGRSERVAEPLARGEIRSCFSMTEPENPGSNPTSVGHGGGADGDGLRDRRAASGSRRPPTAPRSRS